MIETLRDVTQAALDELLAAGLIEEVPTCRISVPQSWRDLLPLDWQPFDGDERTLRAYRNTKAGLEALRRAKRPNDK